MPPKRKKTHTITLDEADKELLELQAKRHKKDQKFIVGYLIGLNEKYNFFGAEDWKDRLIADDEKREDYTLLDGSCPALIHADKVWKCLWGQDGKPPAIKTLAKDLEESLEMCASCSKTLKIKLENESYQVKVQELEAKLEEKATKKFKIPQCKNGGRLDGDGLAFEGCPRSRGKPVSVEEYCKKLNSGLGCPMFKSRLVAVGTEA